MQGKNKFTSAQAHRIRNLLTQKIHADRDEQKKIRGQLRNQLGFYITDFSQSYDGFTTDDFDRLIREGKITII